MGGDQPPVGNILQGWHWYRFSKWFMDELSYGSALFGPPGSYRAAEAHDHDAGEKIQDPQ